MFSFTTLLGERFSSPALEGGRTKVGKDDLLCKLLIAWGSEFSRIFFIRKKSLLNRLI